MYGNLATIIMVMVWLYICMNLLLYGAEINAYFEKEFRIAHKSVQELLAHEKEKKQRCFAQGLTVYRVDPHCRYHGRAVSLDAFHLAENAV